MAVNVSHCTAPYINTDHTYPPTHTHTHTHTQIQVNSVNQKFRGIIPTLVSIGREEGFRGYFKGNGTNVARIIPYVAVQFAAYEEFKKVTCACLSPLPTHSLLPSLTPTSHRPPPTPDMKKDSVYKGSFYK